MVFIISFLYVRAPVALKYRLVALHNMGNERPEKPLRTRIRYVIFAWLSVIFVSLPCKIR